MAEYVMEYDGWAEGIPAVEYLKVRSAMYARKREEIVRCGDCRWRKGVVCGYFDKITLVMDFCSHGTRRTE